MVTMKSAPFSPWRGTFPTRQGSEAHHTETVQGTEFSRGGGGNAEGGCWLAQRRLGEEGKTVPPRARDAASMLEGREVGEEIWLWAHGDHGVLGGDGLRASVLIRVVHLWPRCLKETTWARKNIFGPVFSESPAHHHGGAVDWTGSFHGSGNMCRDCSHCAGREAEGEAGSRGWVSTSNARF